MFNTFSKVKPNEEPQARIKDYGKRQREVRLVLPTHIDRPKSKLISHSLKEICRYLNKALLNLLLNTTNSTALVLPLKILPTPLYLATTLCRQNTPGVTKKIYMGLFYSVIDEVPCISWRIAKSYRSLPIHGRNDQ